MVFVFNLLTVLLVIVSVLLIGLILIQRGRGGGLAGAFGGAGGSSAFGTKAGDVFTRITIGVAAVWFLVCMLLVVMASRTQSSSALRDIGGSDSERPISTGGLLDGKDKDKAGDDADRDLSKRSKADDLEVPPAPTNPNLPPAIDDAPAGKAAAKADADKKAP